MPTSNSNKHSFFQDLSIGALAGLCEVLITNPLFMIKSSLQQRQNNIPRYSPGFLYRGAAINALGMVPSTAIQVGFSKALVNHLDTSAVSASFYAGILSSVITCPVERIMLLQKDHPKLSIKKAIQYTGLSNLFVGQFATALREGGFSVFLLSMTPYFKQELQTSPIFCFQLLKDNDVYAGICASILAGGVFSILSQPIDTIKCYQQSHFIHKIGFFEAQKQLKPIELFNGLTPRALQIILSVTVLHTIKEEIENCLDAPLLHHK